MKEALFFAHLITQNIQRQKLLHRQNCAIHMKGSLLLLLLFFLYIIHVMESAGDHPLVKSNVKAVALSKRSFRQQKQTLAASRVKDIEISLAFLPRCYIYLKRASREVL